MSRGMRKQDGCAVLLVEDDKDLLELFAMVLASAPFAVVCAGSAQAALRVVQSPQSLCAVITDFTLGDGTGAAVIAAARELRPRVAGLLITGHAAGGIALAEGVDVLQKPFSVTQFKQAAMAAYARGSVRQPVLAAGEDRTRHAAHATFGARPAFGRPTAQMS